MTTHKEKSLHLNTALSAILCFAVSSATFFYIHDELIGPVYASEAASMATLLFFLLLGGQFPYLLKFHLTIQAAIMFLLNISIYHILLANPTTYYTPLIFNLVNIFVMGIHMVCHFQFYLAMEKKFKNLMEKAKVPPAYTLVQEEI